MGPTGPWGGFLLVTTFVAGAVFLGPLRGTVTIPRLGAIQGVMDLARGVSGERGETISQVG